MKLKLKFTLMKKNGTKKELKAVVKNESEAWKLINMMTFFVVHSF